jgi:hypothetical protein
MISLKLNIGATVFAGEAQAWGHPAHMLTSAIGYREVDEVRAGVSHVRTDGG